MCELTKQWLERWEKAGAKLEELRWIKIRNSDTAKAIELLSDAFESARIHIPPRPSSGLVEQQALFHRKKQ